MYFNVLIINVNYFFFVFKKVTSRVATSFFFLDSLPSFCSGPTNTVRTSENYNTGHNNNKLSFIAQVKKI